MLDAQKDGRVVFFEKLGEVKGAPALIGLLIKINGPHPVLVAFDIGGNRDDVVIGPHIAQKAYIAAFVELDELLGDADLVEGVGFEVFFLKNVTRYAHDMLFYQGLLMDEENDAVGREQVFQF